MREVTMPLEDIRRLGREKLAGNWLPAMAVMLIYMIFTQFVPDMFNALFPANIPESMLPNDFVEVGYNPALNAESPISGLFKLLFTGAFLLGTTNFFLNLCRTKVSDISLSLSGFKLFGKSLLRAFCCRGRFAPWRWPRDCRCGLLPYRSWR